MHFRPKNRPGERPPHRKLHIARDVLALIETVQKRVFDASGVRLEPEVRLIR